MKWLNVDIIRVATLQKMEIDTLVLGILYIKIGGGGLPEMGMSTLSITFM